MVFDKGDWKTTFGSIKPSIKASFHDFSDFIKQSFHKSIHHFWSILTLCLCAAMMPIVGAASGVGLSDTKLDSLTALIDRGIAEDSTFGNVVGTIQCSPKLSYNPYVFQGGTLSDYQNTYRKIMSFSAFTPYPYVTSDTSVTASAFTTDFSGATPAIVFSDYSGELNSLTYAGLSFLTTGSAPYSAAPRVVISKSIADKYLLSIYAQAGQYEALVGLPMPATVFYGWGRIDSTYQIVGVLNDSPLFNSILGSDFVVLTSTYSYPVNQTLYYVMNDQTSESVKKTYLTALMSDYQKKTLLNGYTVYDYNFGFRAMDATTGSYAETGSAKSAEDLLAYYSSYRASGISVVAMFVGFCLTIFAASIAFELLQKSYADSHEIFWNSFFWMGVSYAVGLLAIRFLDKIPTFATLGISFLYKGCLLLSIAFSTLLILALVVSLLISNQRYLHKKDQITI